jgi:hypothetical protein
MASRITSESKMEVSFDSLPEPILQQILAIVGSQYVLDLLGVKRCSNYFNNYVLKKVSFENCPKFQWEPNEGALAFLKLCEESGNPEVLFSEGLREFFNYPNGNIGGLEKLKIAAEGGYNFAKYAYGMIMLCSENNESRNEGIKHMRYLRMTKCIMHSRKKMQEIREYLWKYNGLLVRNQTLVCKQRPTCGGWRVKRGKWLLQDDEDDDLSSCENCRWDYELQFIYSIFSVPWISI